MQAESIGFDPEDIDDPLFHDDAAATKVINAPHCVQIVCLFSC